MTRLWRESRSNRDGVLSRWAQPAAGRARDAFIIATCRAMNSHSPRRTYLRSVGSHLAMWGRPGLLLGVCALLVQRSELRTSLFRNRSALRATLPGNGGVAFWRPCLRYHGRAEPMTLPSFGRREGCTRLSLHAACGPCGVDVSSLCPRPSFKLMAGGLRWPVRCRNH